MTEPKDLSSHFSPSTHPQAEMAFAYSQTYVDNFDDSTISDYDPAGPTRLLVVVTALGKLQEYTYTISAAIDPGTPDEDVKDLLLQNETGEIVWRGPKSAIYYYGPKGDYTPPPPARPFTL